MANRFADDAASAIAQATGTAQPPLTVLPMLQRFVDALKANNIVGLDREKPALFALSLSGIVKPETSRLAASFWEELALGLALAGQKKLFLAYMDWFAGARDYRPGPTVPSTRLSDAWAYLPYRLDALTGTGAIAATDARSMLDDMQTLAQFIGPLIGDRSADKGEALTAKAIVGTQVAITRLLLVNLQPLMDEGLAELANAAEPRLLRTLFAKIGDLTKIVTDQSATYIQFPIGTFNREISILDSFPPEDRRHFGVLEFDLSQKSAPTTRDVLFVPTLMRRLNQINQALAFYGRAVDPRREATDPVLKMRKANARGLPRPTGFLDHDGLIRLMIMVFLEAHEPLKATPADAIAKGWEATTDFVERYLGTFTAHPGYDLSDLGPDYLATAFPLTIAGEQLHDCAVYALRAAYWLRATAVLLQARNGIDLGMTTRLVFLPNHVALAAAIDPPAMKTAGQPLPAGGLVLLNNSHVEPFTRKELIDKNTDWVSLRPAADKDPTGQAALDLKFVEDLAAVTYQSGLDMPVMSIELLAPTAKVTPSAIWNTYLAFVKSGEKALIFDRKIYIPGTDDLSQFYLRYLAVTLERARFINETMIRTFWRKDAPAIYAKALGKEPWDGPRLLTTMKSYADLMDPLTQRNAKAIQDFAAADQQTLDAINADFAKNRGKIVSRFARASFHERIPDATHLLLILSEELRLVQGHVTDCRNFLAARASGKTTAIPPAPPFMLYDRNEQPL